MEPKLDSEAPDIVFKKMLHKLIQRKQNYGEEITLERMFNATYEYLSQRKVFVYQRDVSAAFMDQKRYKALIQSGYYMPNVFGLWALNDHTKVFKNNQTTYPKKAMDAAIDAYIALNFRKKKPNE